MLQILTNRLLYILFAITLVFGILLYNVINFQNADEICSLLLVVGYTFYIFKTKDWNISKGFLTTALVFIFYICYSIYIESNSKSGILYDVIIQFKPYLAFFTFYQMVPEFSKNEKNILKQSCLVVWFILLPIGLYGLVNPRVFKIVMDHPTVYASCIISLALVYLYCSEYTKKDRLTFIIMLAAALVSGRSKVYGFFVLAAFLIIYLNKPERLKINFKTILISVVVVLGMVFVARDKIQLYFVSSVEGEEKDMMARAVLYQTSGMIMEDYFPFGSGFASFGTHASGLFYSKTYEEYGIENVWGLSRQMPSFISDTYYPSLAQFGVAGIVLFILFWLYALSRSYHFFKQTGSIKQLIIAVLAIGYLAIENIADASFTSNRGFFMMMLLGLVVGEQKRLADTSSKLTEPELSHVITP